MICSRRFANASNAAPTLDKAEEPTDRALAFFSLAALAGFWGSAGVVGDKYGRAEWQMARGRWSFE